MTMEYAIEARGLTKAFPTFTLDRAELQVPWGTVMGLIGENGAGKSTLIKCLLGILTPTSGEASLAGGAGLAEVGYVPDECPFPANLKLRQLGQFLPGIFPNWDGGLFGAYLEKFRLDPAQTVGKLSRGMKMKLSIAAALAHRPRVLVLDEATSGLDPVVRDEILDEFLDFLQDGDRAVLLSSHITSDLEKICDYVTYLHKGAVTVSGPKDELLSRYAVLKCTRAELEQVDRAFLVGERVGQYGCEALVRDRAAFEARWPGLALDPARLEDIMIYTTRRDRP